jgi:hypothetical protein
MRFVPGVCVKRACAAGSAAGLTVLLLKCVNSPVREISRIPLKEYGAWSFCI